MAAFQERLCYALSARYLVFERLVNFLVLLTVFAATLTGVSFWQERQWKDFWVVVSGLATILSISSVYVGGAREIYSQAALLRDFRRLSHEAEMHWQNAQTDAGAIEFDRSLAMLCEKFHYMMDRTNNDPMLFARNPCFG